MLLKIHLIQVVLLNISLFPLTGLTQDGPAPLENAVTLDLSFTIDNFPEDYLVGSSARISVNDNGDMILSNHGKLMVYDPGGVLKTITGEWIDGEAQNELIPADISQTGYIVVGHYWPSVLGFTDYNVYDSNYNFIRHYDELTVGSENISAIKTENSWDRCINLVLYYLNSEEIVFRLSNTPTNRSTEYGIYYYKNGDLTPIELFSRKLSEEENSRFDVIRIKYGSMFHELLPDKKLLYIQSVNNRITENNRWYYELQIAELTSGERSAIRIPFIPVAIPDSVIVHEPYLSDSMDEEMRQYRIESERERSAALKKIGVYPPVRALRSDRQYVFVFTYRYVSGQGYLADVIDSESGILLNKAWFPAIPQTIRNGYAYRTVLPETVKAGFNSAPRYKGEYPVIERYRIDPAVYGKQ